MSIFDTSNTSRALRTGGAQKCLTFKTLSSMIVKSTFCIPRTTEPRPNYSQLRKFYPIARNNGCLRGPKPEPPNKMIVATQTTYDEISSQKAPVASIVKRHAYEHVGVGNTTRTPGLRDIRPKDTMVYAR